jgi:EEF1A lysine methyltransferase 1
MDILRPRSPGSPRSVASSDISGSPPQLDPSTLAILDSFLSSKAEEEKRFNDLAEQASSRLAGAAQTADGYVNTGLTKDRMEDGLMMSVDEYRATFGEDWQLSQFWYSL